MAVAVDLAAKARECAKSFIRAYVLRGDSYESLKESWMGCWHDAYRAGIGLTGGWSLSDPPCKPRRGADALTVTRIGETDCCFEFSLRELYHEIKDGREQLSLF